MNFLFMWQVKAMVVDNVTRGARLPFSLREKQLRYAMVLFTLLLLSANFVGDRSFKLFYFSYSAGTLVIQLVFCWIIGFTETIGFRRTKELIWSTSLANLGVALVSYFLLQFPIPDFWINTEDNIKIFYQLSVVILLTVGYSLSALAMVFAAGRLKLILGRKWLLTRVALTLLAGLMVDIIVLIPILFFIAPDRYMALWNVLSLITVKISLSLVAIPVSYLLVQVLRKRAYRFKI